MKKVYSIVLAGLALFPLFSSAAMGSVELLGNPAKYRVVYAGEDEVVYVDMDTFQGMQTMDYPNSIENLKFTMYVESYRDKIGAIDFAENNLVEKIREYDVTLHVNKKDNSMTMETTLSEAYSADGEILSADALGEEGLIAKDKDLYANLYRLVRLPQKNS